MVSDAVLILSAMLLYSHKLTAKVSSIILDLSNFINIFNSPLCIMHPYSLAFQDDSAKRHYAFSLH